MNWLIQGIVITVLHCSLNMHREDREVVRMGYMPVVTNLAAPLLDFVSRHNGPYRFQAIKFASFAEMAESLRNGHIDAAFMIAPLAIVLRQQKENVRIIYIGNRHESTLVARKDLAIRAIDDLAGKKIGVAGETTNERYLQKDLKIEDVKIVYVNWDADLRTYPTDANHIEDLSLGDGLRLDASFTSRQTVAEAMRSGCGSGCPIKMLGDPPYYEPLCFALDKSRKNSESFLAKLNEIIKSRNPVVYDLLTKKGKKIFFPKKGILGQTADAKGKKIKKPVIQFTLEKLCESELIDEIIIVGHRMLLEQRLRKERQALDAEYAEDRA